MVTAVPKSSPGDLSTFNIQHGFTEALVRGMRSSFLKDADYHHLTQCESLDDVRLNLSESDYSDSIAEFNSLTPNTLQKAAVDKVRIYFVSGGTYRSLTKWPLQHHDPFHESNRPTVPCIKVFTLATLHGGLEIIWLFLQ